MSLTDKQIITVDLDKWTLVSAIYRHMFTDGWKPKVLKVSKEHNLVSVELINAHAMMAKWALRRSIEELEDLAITIETWCKTNDTIDIVRYENERS